MIGLTHISTRDIPKLALVCPLGQDGVLNKATILANLADTLDFPDWFGHNWDAAFDCLLDWAEQHAPQPTLYFLVHPGGAVEETDLVTFCDVLQDVVEQQMQLGKPIRFYLARDTTHEHQP